MMITSIQNPKIQLIRTLLAKPRDRRQHQSFVVDGVRLAEEALLSGWPPKLVIFSDDLSDRGHAVVSKMEAAGAEVEQVSPQIMKSLSETETAQGLLVVFPIRILPFPPSLNFLLIVDAIHDPGNLGTLLRAAAAAGVQGVILTPGVADPYAPKVIRSGMGAHFRLPIQSLDWTETHTLLKQRADPLPVFLADVSQGLPYWEADLIQPLALLIGSEAEGASAFARQIADSTIHIPMPGGSESLNAAVAAAVLLFEVVRQRSLHH
jgi:RNA methyltransferase, TrmH family